MSKHLLAQPPEAHLIAEASRPAYVRIEPAPRVGPMGLCVSAFIQAGEPAGAHGLPQVALAHAEHATGWSLGLDPEGRASLVVGTESGPAVLRLTPPLQGGTWYELVARIPGPLSEPRMTLAVRRRGRADGDAEGSVRIGAPVLNARGPLLWGCRSLFDDIHPEFAFSGRVADVLIVADSSAVISRQDVAPDARRAVRWQLDVAVG